VEVDSLSDEFCIAPKWVVATSDATDCGSGGVDSVRGAPRRLAIMSEATDAAGWRADMCAWSGRCCVVGVGSVSSEARSARIHRSAMAVGRDRRRRRRVS
jgi:hypothetical protein